MDKRSFRKKIFALRDALSDLERERKSAAIAEHLFSLPQWPDQGGVLFFYTMRSEVQTPPMIRRAQQQGLEVSLPRMAGRRTLQLHVVKDLETELQTNALGIAEPRPTLPAVSPDSLAAIIVPGVAFDPEGYRMGYGGGFYDKLLLSAPQAVRVALAFDLQCVPSVPREPHDLPVDAVVTESGPRIFPLRR